MQSPNVIEPMAGERDAARGSPGGYVYRIAGDFPPSERIPPQAIVGAWKVDAQGEIVGEFISNPNYDPMLHPAPRDAG